MNNVIAHLLNLLKDFLFFHDISRISLNEIEFKYRGKSYKITIENR